jgi:high affinity sulfate transporter 1
MTDNTGSKYAGINRWVPGVGLLRSYSKSWLRSDVMAGLVLTTLLVPQGMAYAGLAGLPPVVGLYATTAALLAYAIFGPSRILVLGPDSTLGPMIFAIIAPMLGADPSPSRAIALASALAVMMGLICMAAGLARLGTVAELLSKPVRIGYLNGVAIIILVGQLPKLCGFATSGGAVPRELWLFARGVYRGDAHIESTIIGISALVLILLARRWFPKVPGVAFAVAGSIAAVSLFSLTEHGVTVIGLVPSGFPPLSLPDISWHDVAHLLVAATGLAFVTLADTAPISRSLALKRNEHVDPNREMVAVGVANIAAGLFQGFPISGSVSRSAVAEANGARTQITGVTGAAAIVIILVTAHGLLRNLPAATLGAILISAAIALADVKSLKWLWQVRRSELLLSLTATVGVAWLGPLKGIGVAIGLAVIDFLRRAWRPNSAVLGRVSGRKGYHDVSRHPDALQAPGLVLFRFDAPLFFANADHFAATLRVAINERQEPIHWVVIAAEPITDVDTTAAEMLTALLDDFDKRAMTMAVAEMKGKVKDRLRSYGLLERIGDEHFFPTIGSAMKTYYDVIGLPNPADAE